MLQTLPAVLVGGPPHVGKSVLFYRLTQALRTRGIEHYALRACPDGEGNWFHESDADLVNTLRVKLAGAWPASFVQQVQQAIEHRCVPFLVDMGGCPTASDACLLQACTHSILLLREDQPEATQLWQNLVMAHDILPLARLASRQTMDPSVITAHEPILEGVITGLERNVARSGAGAGVLFDALLERIITLFTACDLTAWRNHYLEHAPTEPAFDIQQELRTFTATSTSWEPTMLTPLLTRWLAQTPLSVYGSGPGWLYATLAAHTDPQPFHLFDPKIPFGWIEPIHVTLDKEEKCREDIQIQTAFAQKATVLTISFPHRRLAYLQSEALSFPFVPTERGLIIDGPLSNWLLTALTRLYKAAGVSWIASFYPPRRAAVVVYSRDAAPQIGDLVPLPES